MNLGASSRNSLEEQVLLVPFSKTWVQRATGPGVGEGGVTQSESGGTTQVCLTSNPRFSGYIACLFLHSDFPFSCGAESLYRSGRGCLTSKAASALIDRHLPAGKPGNFCSSAQLSGFARIMKHQIWDLGQLIIIPRCPLL